VVLEAGRVGDCNAKVLALFRCTRQQLEYRPPFQRLPERLDDGRSSSLAAEEILSAVESGAERQVRWPLVREDGSRFIADLVVKRLDLPAAPVVLIVIRDVTQEIELEERLRQAQKLDAVGQLAGGVAHDFNNMLAGIIGSADLLKSRLASDDERAQRLVTTILTAGDRAASLSRQLLTFTRQSRSVSTPVDVHQIITEALELFGRTVDRRITIDTQLSASPHLVMGDPSQLQNAVLNLCLNSRDAMPDGGRLELTTEVVVLERGFAANLGFDLEAGSYLRLAITDTGVGMSPEVQARIFEPFFTTKEVGRGTGLGLSVVWGTVKDHRGAITIASRPGAGTTIHIYLPLVEQTRSDRIATTPPTEHGSGRILVVEDEDLVRSSTTLLLEDLGYEVISAKDGQQGVEVFEREHGSLFAVLLDAVMPRLGGRDTFRAMRAIDPSVPIILTSGFTRDLAVKDLRDQGLFAFLAKPFPRHELARVIAMAVEARREHLQKGG
jgi:PAS domain S-box-containing protein